MRLSIIIPVYNVQEYVERCIRSLENQDLPKTDYEIIVTNDGSPDNSLDVIKKLQAEFENIVLIDQENQGVSMARNNAIDIAKGKYILPIDPDDYVTPNTLHSLLSLAEKKDLDALYLSFAFFDEQDKLIWQCDFSQLEGQIYSGTETYFITHDKNIQAMDPDRSWAVFYKKEILTKFKIIYPKNVPFLEDGIFLVEFFAIARRCGFSNTLFYLRTSRIGSATKSKLIFTEKSLEGFLIGVDDLHEFNRRFKLNLEQQEVINQGLVKFILLPLTTCVLDKNYKTYARIRKALISKGYRKLNLRGCRQIYKTLGRAYNFSISMFFPYYFFFSKFQSLKIKMNQKF